MAESEEPKSWSITLGWILVGVSGFLVILLLFLFLKKTNPLSSSLDIDPAIFGQYGDVIGGVAGTFVALVGVLFLYETLTLQRTQFQKQLNIQQRQFLSLQSANNKAFKEQQKQIRKQGEDQIFYHLLDRQQNRITNLALDINENRFNGYAAFREIANTLQRNFIDQTIRYGINVINGNPDALSDDDLHTIFNASFRSIHLDDPIRASEYDNIPFHTKKETFVSAIKLKQQKERWNYVKAYANFDRDQFGFVQNQINSIAYSFGHKRLLSATIVARKNSNRIPFNRTTIKFEHELEGYINEVKFICARIKMSISQDLYFDYFKSQITKAEKIYIYYYLLAGFADSNFWQFIKEKDFLGDISQLLDVLDVTIEDNQIKEDFKLIDDLYSNKQSDS
ncbi:MAG TPA: hypothetical protein VIT44_08675 [Cyclobacteriaceae bacterium]